MITQVKPRLIHFHKANKQRGIASLLIILLTGLSLTAITLGAMSHISAAQNAQMSSHTLTQSEVKAWQGARSLTQYLSGATVASTISSCITNTTTCPTITLSSSDGSITSSVTAYSSTTNQITTVTTGASAGSKIKIQAVYKLTGGGSGLQVYSLNNKSIFNKSISSTGSISYNGLTLTVNGDATFAGSGSQGLTGVQATGNVNISGSNTIGSISANGNVTTSGSYNITNLNAGGNFVSNGDGIVSAGSIGGSATVPTYEQAVNKVTSVSGYSPNISVSPPKIDAFALQSQANYIFYIDKKNTCTGGMDTTASANTSQYLCLTISNVQGVTAGTYPLTLGSSSCDNKTKICTGTVQKPTTLTSTQWNTICNGFSSGNCLSYSTSGNKGGTWTLNGNGFAPGVLWFEGDLSINNGTYYDSMIATGNISTSGSTVLSAPNATTSSNVCSVTYAPTNLCTSGRLNNSAIANTALFSGGYIGMVFSGGAITLQNSTAIGGNVAAGDILNTSGSITINGGVIAAGQSTSATSNSLGNSTYLNQAPNDSSLGTIVTGAGSGTIPTITMLWAKYI